MDWSSPGFLVYHQLLELAQTDVHRVSDAIQPTISSSVIPFSSHIQSFPASGSFPMISSSNQVAKVLELQLQRHSFQWILRVDFLLGLTGLMSLQSIGLSRVFPSTTVQKHQFFGAQPSLWFNSHICTWLPEKPSFDIWTFVGKVMSLLFNILTRFV